jgi:hypothetical protein
VSTRRDLGFLLVDRAELQRLIQDCGPEDELMEIGLRGRLRKVEAEIEVVSRAPTAARVALTFDGGPVRAGKGIEADFAGEALGRFQKAIAKTAAAREGRTLGARGPTPRAEQSRLLVTGTVHGSFGFVLEEPETTPSSMALAETLEETMRLLEATKDDEAFGDIVGDTDPEVIAALSKFLTLLASRDATLRLRGDGGEVVMRDPEEVAAAASRTSTVRIEADQETHGVLEGLLPTSRRFEFRPEGEEAELIVGRIAPSVSNPEDFKRFVDQRCVAHFRVVTFQRPGKGQRRFLLRAVEPLSIAE